MENDVLTVVKALMRDGYPGLVDDYLKTTRFHMQMIAIKLAAGNVADIALHTHVIRSSSAALGFMRLSRLASSLEDLVLVADSVGRDLGAIGCIVKGMQSAFAGAQEVLRAEAEEGTIRLKTITGCV